MSVNNSILGTESVFVNTILPHKNKWAWDLFVKGQANNWVPSEVSMGKDIEQWRSRDVLSNDEKLLLKRCLGFFAGSESLVANNLLLSIFKAVNDAECRQYILRQAYEEALHNQTIVYICDSLDLDVNEVYRAYQTIPAIRAKDDFLMSITKEEKSSKADILRDIITYYIICEGLFFYSGFAMLLSFGRQNKLPGVSEQIQYTLRDESLHIEFGTNLIHTIIKQEGDVWSDSFKQQTVEQIRTATDLEVDYTRDVLPRGVLGLNADLFVGYMQYIANRRLASLGFPTIFSNPINPFPWLTETIDLAKQKNFFETRVTQYSVGTFIDDLE